MPGVRVAALSQTLPHLAEGPAQGCSNREGSSPVPKRWVATGEKLGPLPVLP